MKDLRAAVWQLVIIALILFPGCSNPSNTTNEIRHYPVDGIENLIDSSGIVFDKDISSDGRGSIRINASGLTTIRLYETGDIDLENIRLEYRAMVKTKEVTGKVYLEMVCHFPGSGEFFSRGLQNPITGTVNWTTEETPFFLRKGQNPDNVKLNLIIDGTGIVWIDDIRLLKWTAK